MGRSGSGKKRAAVLEFLGFTTADAGAPGETGYHVGGGATNKVRPSDEDGYLEGRPWWFAERDIDRRASEFIDRVHRGITLSTGGSDGPSSSSSVHY